MPQPLQILTVEPAGLETRESTLFVPCEPIDDTFNYSDLLARMIETTKIHDICVGLAAPQVGVSRQIAVVWLDKEQSNPLVMINPRVTDTSGKKDTKRESCMSFPGYCGNVVRRMHVTVEYLDEGMSSKRDTFEGFFARAVQHEIDHLSGILYCEHTIAAGQPLVETDLFAKSNFAEVQAKGGMMS